MIKFLKQKGFSLVEIVVAVAIFALLAVGAASIIGDSTSGFVFDRKFNEEVFGSQNPA